MSFAGFSGSGAETMKRPATGMRYIGVVSDETSTGVSARSKMRRSEMAPEKAALATELKSVAGASWPPICSATVEKLSAAVTGSSASTPSILERS